MLNRGTGVIVLGSRGLRQTMADQINLASARVIATLVEVIAAAVQNVVG
jgi:hypothetical protein